MTKYDEIHWVRVHMEHCKTKEEYEGPLPFICPCGYEHIISIGQIINCKCGKCITRTFADACLVSGRKDMTDWMVRWNLEHPDDQIYQMENGLYTREKIEK